MTRTIKILLIFHLFATVKGSFRLYNTNVSDNRDYKDCLYSFVENSSIKEWQLVPYCIRNNVQSSDDGGDQCDGEEDYTFEQLKSKNVDSHHLYRWNAPIDTINDYQKYVAGDDLSLDSHRYCNCSANSFGTRCQYSFGQSNEATTFNEIIMSQFRRKQSLKDNYEIINDPSMLTCYEGLRCHSTICLDWRQICDHIFNCENGEDEPEECLLLETNECNNDEYRCRYGACIPTTFLIDFSYDCMDFSDESENNLNLQVNHSDCYSLPTLACEFRLDALVYFSCSDGQYPKSGPWEPSCNNGRELFLRRSLLLSSSPNDGNSSKNISFECWFFMLCISGEKNTTLVGHVNGTCECSKDSLENENNRCLVSFRKHCPVSFTFQTVWNPLYPFVRFLYHNPQRSYFEWHLPTHVCYNQSYCPAFPFAGLPLIDGLMCIKREGGLLSLNRVELLLRAFSACSIPHTPMLAGDKRLFNCNRSMKIMSKHRVDDGFTDCYFREDALEFQDAAVMYILNLTDRFKCNTTDQWLSRTIISDKHCEDNSDTLYIGACKIASDIGCQFLRGLYSPPVYYLFQENCNSALKLRFPVKNETDETSCDEWPINRCDDRWNVINGEDELNCSYTTTSYITRTVLKCSVNEHYCAHRNGTMGCLAKELAGDGNIDCLGATDERKTSCAFSEPEAPFSCSSDRDQCLYKQYLCNGLTECSDKSDELWCPFLSYFKCDVFYFSCKNGTCISDERRCDDVIDCQPDAEDEWFCDLEYRGIPQFSLANIDEYPSVIDSLHLTKATGFHPSASLPVADVLFRSVNSLNDWFCNRGIIVTKRSSNIECFCPPSYYGPRCEYQSERLLITVRIDTLASLSGHQNQQNAIRLFACLMLDHAVVHHETILHVPLRKQMFYLNYPRPPPKKSGNWSVRLDAFSVTRSNVDFKASWLFTVPFSFLPVNRLVLHLILIDQETCNTLTCAHGNCRKYLNPPHHEYCQCEENWSGIHCNVSVSCSCARNGKCVGQRPRSICICPLGYMGSECRASFDPCSNDQCQHGGTCLALDERQHTKFICSCRSGYYGLHCEEADAYVIIHFSSSLSPHSRSLSAAVFVHFLELDKESPGVLLVQNRLLHKQVQLNKPLHVFNHNQKYLSTFILLQIFFDPDNFDYYIAAILKSQRTNITTTISKLNRFPHVDDLLLNETVRAFSSIKKVKYYHRVCEVSNTSNWFYDEAFLCFCDKNRRLDCLFFKQEETHCAKDYCQNNARCVKNDFNGVWDFGCVCSGCAYGSLCQLTTSQYVLSLEVMLGQDILQNMPLTEQPLLIKIVLTVLVLMFSLGFVSNVLSLTTFKQSKVQEFGCGVYLFCMPLVGQLGLSMFIGRFIYLLRTQLYNVDNRSAAQRTCVALEYLLSVCPMLFDWLTACVAVERSVNIIEGVSFKKVNSVWWAKRIILLLMIIVLASAWHEPLIRQVVDDPREMTRHTWCVITFPWPWLEYYRLTVNMINLIVPCSINLVATVFLLHKSTRMKQAFVTKQSEKGYWMLFKKQLPLYGSPLGIIVLSMMRLIFSFTLVCIVHQWQKYVYLTAYFISFIPLMGTFPIFVLPAKIYKTEFKNFVQRTIKRLKRLQIK